MLRKYIIFCSVALVLSFILNRVYESMISPESVFFGKCIATSENWAQKVREGNQPCYIFAGGSEVRMGIEPAVMLQEHGIRSINAGVQAGNGLRCNAEIGLHFLKPGDTLVLSVFAHDTNLNKGMGRDGVNFCFTKRGFKCFNEGILPFSSAEASNLFLGSSSKVSVHIMRLLTRPNCVYWYSNKENARVSESGRVEVLRAKNEVSLSTIPSTPHVFSIGFDTLINDINMACKARGANLLIYFPRRYVSSIHRIRHAITALHLIERGVPVLRDPYLGTWENKDSYSDTSEHLSVQSGKDFSSFLAKCLKEKDFWTEEELRCIIHSSESMEEQ